MAAARLPRASAGVGARRDLAHPAEAAQARIVAAHVLSLPRRTSEKQHGMSAGSVWDDTDEEWALQSLLTRDVQDLAWARAGLLDSDTDTVVLEPPTAATDASQYDLDGTAVALQPAAEHSIAEQQLWQGFEAAWQTSSDQEALEAAVHPAPTSPLPGHDRDSLQPPVSSSQAPELQEEQSVSTGSQVSALALPVSHASASTQASGSTALTKSRLRQQRRVSRPVAQAGTAGSLPQPAGTSQASQAADKRQQAAKQLARSRLYSRQNRAKLLTRAEENTLARQFKDLVALQQAESELRDVLRRKPTLAELAKAVRSTPEDVDTRMMLGTAAKKRLIASNMGMVTSVAIWVHSTYIENTRRTMSFDDLKEEGVHGLMHALAKFDPDSGYKLSTYALPWIRQFMTREVQKQGSLLRLPVPVHEEISKVRRACMALDDQLQRKPTSWEVAAKLGWTVERVELAMSAAKVDASAGTPMSLDTHDDDDTDGPSGVQATLSNSVNDSTTFDASVGRGLLQDSAQSHEFALKKDFDSLVERAIDSILPKGPAKVRYALLCLFRSRIGLVGSGWVLDEDANGGDLGEGAEGQTGVQGSGKRQPRQRASSRTRAMGLRGAARMCGVTYEYMRVLEKRVCAQMRVEFGAELEQLAVALEREGSSGTVERATAGAHKKS